MNDLVVSDDGDEVDGGVGIGEIGIGIVFVIQVHNKCHGLYGKLKTKCKNQQLILCKFLFLFFSVLF